MEHEMERRPELSDGEAGQKQTRLSWFRCPQARRVRIAAAGYAAVVAFGIAAVVARAVGASSASVLVVGALAAAPLVVAFIGDRITGVTAFSVRISLSELRVPAEGDFSRAVMTSAEMGGSAQPELLTIVRPLMESGKKLLRINLRDDKYWWSTRIFLVAALASDYTEVEALVFVRADEDRIFVGIASANAVRKRLAARFPDYESRYRIIRSGPTVATADNDQQVQTILTGWPYGHQPPEADIKKVVSSNDLKEWLRGDLDTESFPDGPLTPLLRYRIISRAWRYAALTDHSRFTDVVDRNELAIRTTAAELEAFLSRSN
jgi:hypothetical protein